jgi:transcriptional regulator GlxA family with amidase domain
MGVEQAADKRQTRRNRGISVTNTHRMNASNPIRVSLVATPEVDASALAGLHGVFSSFSHMVPNSVSFDAEVVAPDLSQAPSKPSDSLFYNVMGMPLPMQRRLRDVQQTDVLIIPSLYLLTDTWPTNPYPDLTEWILQMHNNGTLVCSACTAALLLAETGLLDGYEATMHWAFERLFRSRFPKVRLNIDKALIQTGKSGRIVMSGASAAWHDLIVYLISHYANPQSAQVIAKYFLLSVHADGQAPYKIFQENLSHEDRAIYAAQLWLRQHRAEPNPVEKVVAASNLHERTFVRRFHAAAGCTPISYVQHLRVEDAKQRLESTDTSIDQIGWVVGYEDPASFRRLFKRLTGLTPKAYRKKFQSIGINY